MFDGWAALDSAELTTAIGEAPRTRSLSEPVRKAVRCVIAHHDRPLVLADLAALAARTPFQLIRAFRRELGITPHALLIRVRVWRGTWRLLQGEPIASIATGVGFVDQAHFTRHFKRVHGRTPGRFLGEIAAVELKPADAGGDRCGAGAR
jgi:transcriptional regulator GlxA family with amidase domain